MAPAAPNVRCVLAGYWRDRVEVERLYTQATNGARPSIGRGMSSDKKFPLFDLKDLKHPPQLDHRKLHAFQVAPTRKTAFEKAKEQAQQKAERDAAETAAAYEAFVAEYGTGDDKKSSRQQTNQVELPEQLARRSEGQRSRKRSRSEDDPNDLARNKPTVNFDEYDSEEEEKERRRLKLKSSANFLQELKRNNEKRERFEYPHIRDRQNSRQNHDFHHRDQVPAEQKLKANEGEDLTERKDPEVEEVEQDVQPLKPGNWKKVDEAARSQEVDDTLSFQDGASVDMDGEAIDLDGDAIDLDGGTFNVDEGMPSKLDERQPSDSRAEFKTIPPAESDARITAIMDPQKESTDVGPFSNAPKIKMSFSKVKLPPRPKQVESSNSDKPQDVEATSLSDSSLTRRPDISDKHSVISTDDHETASALESNDLRAYEELARESMKTSSTSVYPESGRDASPPAVGHREVKDKNKSFRKQRQSAADFM